MNAFSSIQQGLHEALEYAQGNTEMARAYTPQKINVQEVRKKTEMTQELFSAAFGISLGTLRHWEQGDRTPRGPALVLLNMIDQDPKTILNLLHPRKDAPSR